MSVSLRPSQATVGGGLLDDADVTITSARFILWDYDGKIAQEQPALEIVFSQTHENGETSEHKQCYSAGDARFFVPSEDQKQLEAVGDKTALSASTNAIQFLTSLVNAGFDEAELDKGVGGLEGLYVHVAQKAQPKRTGLVNPAPSTSGREKTILLVTEILEKKGKKAGGGAAKTTKSAPAAATAPAETGGDLDEDALGATVLGIVDEAGGAVPVAKLISEVFKQYRADADLKAVAGEASKRAKDAEFLAGIGLAVKAGKVTAAE